MLSMLETHYKYNINPQKTKYGGHSKFVVSNYTNISGQIKRFIYSYKQCVANITVSSQIPYLLKSVWKPKIY